MCSTPLKKDFSAEGNFVSPSLPCSPKKLFDSVCRPFLLLTSNGKRAEILLKILYSTGEPPTAPRPNNYFCLKMSIRSRLRNLVLKQVYKSIRAKPSICFLDSFGSRKLKELEIYHMVPVLCYGTITVFLYKIIQEYCACVCAKSLQS